MRAGRQRWLAEMHAKKAAGEIEWFPGGRKSGSGGITPRMWDVGGTDHRNDAAASCGAGSPPTTIDATATARATIERPSCDAKSELGDALAQVRARQDEVRLTELLAALDAGRE
jgi:hypothetical protein